LLRKIIRAAFRAALFICGVDSQKVFNTTVDNAVEKDGRIFVSDSAGDGSALCTAASAGTFVVRLQAIAERREEVEQRIQL
jgi:hypothetical protein